MQRLKCIKKEDNPEGITLLLPTSQKLYQKGEKNKTKKVEMGEIYKTNRVCSVLLLHNTLFYKN